jgi:hypothetical protein
VGLGRGKDGLDMKKISFRQQKDGLIPQGSMVYCLGSRKDGLITPGIRMDVLNFARRLVGLPCYALFGKDVVQQGIRKDILFLLL